MASKLVEIICSECNADSLLVRSPEYDGFKKIGELLKCGACGHEYPCEDDVPFKGAKKNPTIFDDSDRDAEVDVFKNDARGRLCRYCRHYVMNPFVQKCGLHMRLVEATDVCDDFEAKPEESEDAAESGDDVPSIV